MPKDMALRHAWVLFAIAILVPASAHSGFIDFETLPGGDPTVDQQEISDEYAVYGVTFTLLDRSTGEPIGFPRIAKAGEPLTAFQGCLDVDAPRPHLDLGVSFLTDGTTLGVDGDLLIEYATPVAEASGVILDIDCRTSGGPPCEQWTVTAYDELGGELDTVVLDAPTGPNPGCVQPEVGPGDAEAFGWNVTADSDQIVSIVLRYTGTATNVGLAFDSFSVVGQPDPPSVTVMSPVDTVCAGESIELTAVISGGLPPYTYQWQEKTGSSSWSDLGTGSSQEVQPEVTSQYRMIVTDALMNETTSEAIEVIVIEDDPVCAADLLVGNYGNSRVVRYSFRGHSATVFVPSGSGGLAGPSELRCGPDGDLYVTNQTQNEVLRYDGTTGDFKEVFVTSGSGGLNTPVGMDFGPDGNLYVASYNTHQVLRYDGTDGTFMDAFVPNGSGLNNPTGLVFGPDDNLYVSSLGGNKVLHFDGSSGTPLGDFVTTGSGGLNGPRGLTFGPDGHLYIAEQINDSVRRYDGTTGDFMDVFVASGSGGLNHANDVVFGLDGALYVPSYVNHKVLRFDGTTGAFINELPNDLLNGPNWVALGCQSPTAGVAREIRPALNLWVESAVPNPFNPHTTVGFMLGSSGPARVTVVDVRGRIVATLLDRSMPAGRHTVEWNGRNSEDRAVASGVYFMCVESRGAHDTVKMLLVQ